MEVMLMAITRKTGTLLALPLVLTALSGAATSPTLTYHGVFDPEYTVAGNCGTPADRVASGVWNVQIPNPDGATASAELMIHLDGKTDVRGSAKLVLVESTEDGFVARTEPPLLTFSLDGDAFTYEVSFGTCHITYNGHATH
jgi:hypothetical protein